MSDDWKNNPRLSGMDLRSFPCFRVWQIRDWGKIRPNFCLLSWAQLLKEKMRALNFSSDEISTIIEVLKMGKSPAEAAKLDRIVNLMKMIRH